MLFIPCPPVEMMAAFKRNCALAVLQDVASYEATQETLALLKILALGQQDMEAKRLEPLSAVVERLGQA